MCALLFFSWQCIGCQKYTRIIFWQITTLKELSAMSRNICPESNILHNAAFPKKSKRMKGKDPKRQIRVLQLVFTIFRCTSWILKPWFHKVRTIPNATPSILSTLKSYKLEPFFFFWKLKGDGSKEKTGEAEKGGKQKRQILFRQSAFTVHS